MFRTKFADVF